MPDTSLKSMTVQEWLEYDVPEGSHAELVDGELRLNPLPGYPHQRVVHQLNRILLPYHLAHPEVVKTLMIPARVVIPGLQEGREPDLALYATEPEDWHRGPGWDQIRPILIVEVVSPDQESRDYVEKYSSYHRAQIPEYWIADPQTQRFTALMWTSARWIEHVFEREGIYTTPLLPGLSVRVADLWR